MKKLMQLEDENAWLKKIVAGLTLDRKMLQDIIRRNVWSALSLQGFQVLAIAVFVNVSGLSRVDCCCSQALMRSAHDQLATGKKLRVLTVVDTFSRYLPVLDPTSQLSR